MLHMYVHISSFCKRIKEKMYENLFAYIIHIENSASNKKSITKYFMHFMCTLAVTAKGKADAINEFEKSTSKKRNWR